MLLHPVQARLDELLHPAHFLLVAGEDEPVGIDGPTEDGPALVVALLRFGEGRGHRIDPRENFLGGEDVGAELGKAVHVTLAEVSVVEEAAIPGEFLVVELRPEPVFGQPPLFSVGVAEAQVPIPDRVGPHLAAAILVIKNGEAKTIHVLRHLGEQVVVDEGVHIEESTIALGRVAEVRAVKRSLQLIEMILQPRFLHGGDFIRVRFHEVELVGPRGPEVFLVLHRIVFVAIDGVAVHKRQAGGSKAQVVRVDGRDPAAAAGPGTEAAGRGGGREETFRVAGKTTRAGGEAGAGVLRDHARTVTFAAHRATAGVGVVLLENIAAGHVWLRHVLRLELGDVHALLAALDPFLEHIHACVVATRELAAGAVHEDLDKLRAWRPVPHVGVQFVGEHVTQERLVGVGRVEHPVAVRRQAEQRHRRRITRGVDGLYGEGVLGITQRSAPAHIEQRAPREAGGLRERRAFPARLDELHRALDARLAAEIGAKGVHDDERQIGGELGEILVQQCEHLGPRRARCSVFGKQLHPQEHRVGDEQWRGVARRSFIRLAAVQRVAQDRTLRRGEPHGDIAAIRAARRGKRDGAGRVLRFLGRERGRAQQGEDEQQHALHGAVGAVAVFETAQIQFGIHRGNVLVTGKVSGNAPPLAKAKM